MPAPEPGQAWGILGGSFDPVHRGHVNLALEMLKARSLNGILLVPTFAHPHSKAISADFEDRVAILEKAIVDHKELWIEEIERELEGPSYTLDTVRALKKRYPNVEFYFIVGQDIINELDSWYATDELFEEVTFLVGLRPPAKIEGSLKKLPPDRIEVVQSKVVQVSSTEVRRLIADDNWLDLEKYLEPDVINFIREKGLYR